MTIDYILSNEINYSKNYYLVYIIKSYETISLNRVEQYMIMIDNDWTVLIWLILFDWELFNFKSNHSIHNSITDHILSNGSEVNPS